MPIYKGDIQIGKIFKGSTQIGKVYKGSTLIYQYVGCPSVYDAERSNIYRYGSSTINKMPSGYTQILAGETVWIHYSNAVNTTTYDREAFYYFLPIGGLSNFTVKVYDINCNLISDLGTPTLPYYNEIFSAGTAASDRLVAITNTTTTDYYVIYFSTLNNLNLTDYYGSYPCKLGTTIVDDWITTTTTEQTITLNSTASEVTIIPVYSSTNAVTVKNTSGFGTYLHIKSYAYYSNTVISDSTSLGYLQSTTVSIGSYYRGFIIAFAYNTGDSISSLTINN